MILVIALLIAPGAIAFLLTAKFNTMMWLSVLISVTSSVLGVYSSFYLDSAPAPTIIMVMSLCFIVVFCYTSYRNKQIANRVGEVPGVTQP